jgi:hypothetical protein
VSVLPFSSAILLGSVGTSQSVQYSMLSEEVFELIGRVFSSIITLNLLNDNRKLFFNQQLKLGKALKNITFINDGIQLGVPTIIIYKDNIKAL